MKLNHINLVVTNVAEAIHFFETYFNFTCTEVKGDNVVAVLKGVDDFTLVIMTSKESIAYPAAFHIGFMLSNEEEVSQCYVKLTGGGISIEHAPKKIRDSFGFYFHFGGIMIEVGCYFD